MNTRIIHGIMRHIFFVPLFAGLMGLAPSTMRAQASGAGYDGPSVLPTDITAGLEVFNFDYKEDFTPPNKSTENGVIPGIHISTTTNRRYPFFVQVGLGYAEATETYDGSTQLGAPRVSDTKSTFFEIGFSGNYRIALDEGLTVTPHAGLTYRLWNRDILGEGGVEEMYTWHSIPVGAELAWRPGGSWSIGIDCAVVIMVQGKIKIYFSKLDEYTPDAVLTLGNKLGFHVALPVRFALSERWSLGITPYFDSYSFGRSNPYREDGHDLFLEPASRTYRIGGLVEASFGL